MKPEVTVLKNRTMVLFVRHGTIVKCGRSAAHRDAHWHYHPVTNTFRPFMRWLEDSVGGRVSCSV